MSSLKETTTNLSSLIQASYLLRQESQNKELVLLLHGYQYHAHWMWKQLEQVVPKDGFDLLSLNGPFPVPHKKKDGYVMTYSWYFYDPKEQKYVMGFEFCQDYVQKVLKHIGKEYSKIHIIGFSQGGYAALPIAYVLPQVETVIGIGCQVRLLKDQAPPHVKVHMIHGEKDELVSLENARSSFAQLPESLQAQFIVLPELAHTIEDSARSKIREIISSLRDDSSEDHS